jgi:hypothetical protein
MSTHKTDVAGEYLREVELRLSGLPLLQRRELLADLDAHIAEARQHVQSEGELIEVLERLGSPEVVAAAAYQEAGPPLPPPAPPPMPPPVHGMSPPPVNRGRQTWLIVLIVVAALVFVLCLAGVLGFSRGTTLDSEPIPAGPPPAPTAPR